MAPCQSISSITSNTLTYNQSTITKEDNDNLRITTPNFHNLVDGQRIVYSSSGNLPLGIGSFGGSNTNQNDNLVNGGIYYPEIINTKAIYLYKNLSDYSAGINTVDFQFTYGQGTQSLRSSDRENIVSSIVVTDPGEGYKNKKRLIFKF